MKPLVYRKAKRDRTKPVVRHQMHVTKGDTVRVMRGANKGKEGLVLRVLPKRNRVVVDGINLVKKHRKPTSAEDQGGIITMPAPIHASNVMLLDPKSGEPTRVKRQKDKDGSVERLSVKTGRPIPRKRT
jgi:large subunit ribosomal protein L24